MIFCKCYNRFYLGWHIKPIIGTVNVSMEFPYNNSSPNDMDQYYNVYRSIKVGGVKVAQR